MKFLLIILAITSITGAIPKRPKNNRIFGGQDAELGQFPFAAALIDDAGFVWCSGSIVSDSWILTSAGCLQPFFLTSVIVGTNSQSQNGISYNISNYIMHEEYNNAWTNDVALIQIDGTLEFGDNIQPIDFGEVADNVSCTVMGWGNTQIEWFPDILQYVEATTVDVETCNDLTEPYLGFPDLGSGNVCAVSADTQGACLGDEGGPLVCDGLLAGYMSINPTLDVCGIQVPAIFTRVSAYSDWILSNIGE